MEEVEKPALFFSQGLNSDNSDSKTSPSLIFNLDEAQESLENGSKLIKKGLELIEKLRTQSPDSGDVDDRVLGRRALKIYSIRRAREKIFGGLPIFSEPCWDILLDLFIAYAYDEKRSMKSVCFASCVAPTTAYRWISLLEESQLAQRTVDENDARRILVSLTEVGKQKMREVIKLITIA